MKRKKKHLTPFIKISLDIYRVYVVVTWATTLKQIIAFAKRHSLIINADSIFVKDFNKLISEDVCKGFCISFGDNNCDVLVYLKERPKRTKEYGVLYHELHHAVRHIVDSRNLGEERESPAYLYEFISEKCNKVFWNLK